VPAGIVQAVGDQVMHTLPAHVAEGHRWTGRVLGVSQASSLSQRLAVLSDLVIASPKRDHVVAGACHDRVAAIAKHDPIPQSAGEGRARRTVS
jgi:hypothetical protein